MTQDTRTILHAFADHGSESIVLCGFGTVTRATLNPKPNDYVDETYQMDLVDEVPPGEYDLGLLHPPCTKWAGQTDISGDRDDHPNLIPRARELARQLCDEWIIENVPAAPLNDPVVLDGRAFGLPIRYQRAFETSFPVDEPPRYGALGEAETSPHYYSERSRAWWAAAKGYPATHATKDHLAKNCLPAPYVRHLVRSWLTTTGEAEGCRSYDGYHDEVRDRRRASENQQLEAFKP